MIALIKLLCLVLCVCGVTSMSIRGEPLLKYDPCGLGVIFFDKLVDKFWQASVFLDKYPALNNQVSMQVNFERNVTVVGVNAKDPVVGQSFQFWINGTIPPKYVFFVQLHPDDETNVPKIKTFALNNQTLCDDSIKASQTIESLNVTRDKNHYAHICGRRAIDHTELTLTQTDSTAGEWPWHVAILFILPNSNDTRYVCGGNIISRTSIVTAGHCVRENGLTVNKERIVIVAGVDNHKDVNQVGRQVLMADEIVLHPNYDDREATADLAVIKVNKFKYTEYVQPICVWGPVYDKTTLFGYNATVVGFGTTEENRLSDVLRSAHIQVQNDTTCLDSDRSLYTPLLNEFTFCAGYGPQFDTNPRNGDSGGGLVVPTIQPDHKVSWFLRGVLSKCGVGKGETQCNPHFYTVFTDVGPHYGWIYHHSGLQFNVNIWTKM